MWRVFSCVKSTTNSQVILAALIRAYEAGVDVISISIGGASSWTSDATNTAFNNIIEQGVVGNE
jgi:pyruvate/oxaloacetate carboxyltransferase